MITKTFGTPVPVDAPDLFMDSEFTDEEVIPSISPYVPSGESFQVDDDEDEDEFEDGDDWEDDWPDEDF